MCSSFGFTSRNIIQMAQLRDMEKRVTVSRNGLLCDMDAKYTYL